VLAIRLRAEVCGIRKRWTSFAVWRGRADCQGSTENLFTKQGMQIRLGARVTGHGHQAPSKSTVSFTDGRWRSSKLDFSTAELSLFGRKPYTRTCWQ